MAGITDGDRTADPQGAGSLSPPFPARYLLASDLHLMAGGIGARNQLAHSRELRRQPTRPAMLSAFKDAEVQISEAPPRSGRRPRDLRACRGIRACDSAARGAVRIATRGARTASAIPRQIASRPRWLPPDLAGNTASTPGVGRNTQRHSTSPDLTQQSLLLARGWPQSPSSPGPRPSNHMRWCSDR